MRALLACGGLLSLILIGGCVVSTYEGPDKAPRSGAHLFVPQASSASAERPPPGPEKISARHVLVMHRASKSAPEGIVRSREEALARAQEVQRRASEGEDFAQLAAEFSDEPGAAERGGDLGEFPRGVMVQAFEEAAFVLKKGQVSEIIETEFGFHVIQRTK